MLKIKDREKNLKAAKGKQLLTNQEASISLKANFSPEMLEARMQCDTCSSIKRKELSIKDLTSTKIPFKNERKIEGWSKTVIQKTLNAPLRMDTADLQLHMEQSPLKTSSTVPSTIRD